VSGRFFSVFASTALVVGCSSCGRAPRPEGGSGGSEGAELVLYCGAGIRPAATALITAFETRNPVKVSATYAGSGRLIGQLSSSRRGDLFMPGAEYYVDKMIERGLARADTKRTVARFVPVIFVGKGNPRSVASLADFTRKDIRAGLGDERVVAIGRRSRRLFEKNGIPYDSVLDSTVYTSGTVNELGVAVEMRSVDATIVWDAVARRFAGDIVEIPPEENIVSDIAIAVLSFSRRGEAAERFIDFAASDEGRRIFREHGYTVGPPVGKGRE